MRNFLLIFLGGKKKREKLSKYVSVQSALGCVHEQNIKRYIC